jgi:hypothetical protein
MNRAFWQQKRSKKNRVLMGRLGAKSDARNDITQPAVGISIPGHEAAARRPLFRISLGLALVMSVALAAVALGRRALLLPLQVGLGTEIAALARTLPRPEEAAPKAPMEAAPLPLPPKPPLVPAGTAKSAKAETPPKTPQQVPPAQPAQGPKIKTLGGRPDF